MTRSGDCKFCGKCSWVSIQSHLLEPPGGVRDLGITGRNDDSKNAHSCVSLLFIQQNCLLLKGAEVSEISFGKKALDCPYLGELEQDQHLNQQVSLQEASP